MTASDNAAELLALADALVSQEDEPCWLNGNYAERMNYWRDKAIKAAAHLRTLAQQEKPNG